MLRPAHSFNLYCLHVSLYIYIYIYVCVCIYVSFIRQGPPGKWNISTLGSMHARRFTCCQTQGRCPPG